MGLNPVLGFRALGRNRQKKEVARAKRKAAVEEGGDKERRRGHVGLRLEACQGWSGHWWKGGSEARRKWLDDGELRTVEWNFRDDHVGPGDIIKLL